MKSNHIEISRKKDLKILVEDFLEQDYNILEKTYDNHSRIFQLLCDPAEDVDDLTPDELKETILKWYVIVSPVWGKIKDAFIDYRNNILPEREKSQKMVSAVNDPSSSLSEYKDLVNGGYGVFTEEKTYTIELESPATINLSLSSDKFNISMESIRVVDKLLLQIKDAPTDYFSVCGYCGKIIVISRKGKRYHSGCASKAKQKELWTKDPEGCRERERNRYHQRKKKRK
jgi:hypothetical protein